MSQERNSRCTGFDSPMGQSRRQILSKFGMGLGAMALASLGDSAQAKTNATALTSPHHFGKAKRVIYLFQSGGPSQLELFDYKPTLQEKQGTELPESIRKGQRLTAMSGNQASLPLVGTPFDFKPRGKSGVWMSDRIPYHYKIADDMLSLIHI